MINWLALGKAKKKTPQYLQWFATKHAAGVCDVNKFMKIWKE
jgi:hypothetical protein